MQRDTESNFLNNLEISTRGLVKVASSQVPKEAAATKDQIKKMLTDFSKKSPKLRNLTKQYLQRLEFDRDPKKVGQDFFKDLSTVRASMQSVLLSTARCLRQHGVFKVSSRDVYEDLETGDFWKISEDKKHVVRLFKENEQGISDKRASVEKIATSTKKYLDSFSEEMKPIKDALIKIKDLGKVALDTEENDSNLSKYENLNWKQISKVLVDKDKFVISKSELEGNSVYKLDGDLEDGHHHSITTYFVNSVKRASISSMYVEDEVIDPPNFDEKAAVELNTYSVMGSTPGDGGVVKGVSFDDAVATFWLLDAESAGWTKKQMFEEIKKKPGKKINDAQYNYGDYEVKLIKKASIELEVETEEEPKQEKIEEKEYTIDMP